MKKYNRARSSSLFLLELIIAILFFTIASAVCVQLFVKSHNLSQDSQELDFAVNEACSIAETVQTCDSEKSIADAVQNIYPDSDVSRSAGGTNCMICFDSSFTSCRQDDSDYAYCMETSLKTSDGMIYCDIAVSEKDSDDPIYELEVKHNAQNK